jgi:hypothetical protein
MKIKRSVFYVDETKREIVKQFLNLNQITWSGKGFFKFDLNTAVVTAMVMGILFILILAIG